MDSSRIGDLPADFLVRCPEQFEERLRVAAKSAVAATAREWGWTNSSTHPDISVLSSISGRHSRMNSLQWETRTEW